MFWFYLGHILRFLLTAPFFVIGFLFIPRRFHEQVLNASPRWARCWAGLHEWGDHPNSPDVFKWRKCLHCDEAEPMYYP
jgi:hypothetical protein